MSYRNPLSRRTVLKGLGISLGLPWLESARAFAGATAGAVSPPRRLACIFVPNGVHLPDWTPKTEGFGFKLPHILEPLAPVQDELLVVSGLSHDKGRANGDGPGDHARSASVFLTGARPARPPAATSAPASPSIKWPRRPSAISRSFHPSNSGVKAAAAPGIATPAIAAPYSSNISWASSSQPLAKEINPRLAFERLFANKNVTEADRSRIQREALRKSLLDFVADDAKKLQGKLGRNDQRKLDEYLTGVREIERRIERAEKDSLIVSPAVDYKSPTGVPSDFGEHLRLMCDMMVLAFQTDSTRVASMMFADAGSNRSYRLIDVPEGHHDLSHHGGDAEARKDPPDQPLPRRAIVVLRAEAEVDSAKARGRCSITAWLSTAADIGDGNRHNHDDLPLLLLGRGGGTIDSGRHIRFTAETPMCNLFLSMLDRIGAPCDYIGDSTDQVSALTV